MGDVAIKPQKKDPAYKRRGFNKIPAISSIGGKWRTFKVSFELD